MKLEPRDFAAFPSFGPRHCCAIARSVSDEAIQLEKFWIASLELAMTQSSSSPYQDGKKKTSCRLRHRSYTIQLPYLLIRHKIPRAPNHPARPRKRNRVRKILLEDHAEIVKPSKQFPQAVHAA
jgi:hypothetical protein